MDNNFVSELVGTAILILLGNGVVAGVLLARSKAQNAGWIVITFGWGMAVAIAVYAAGGRRALEDYGKSHGGQVLQLTHQIGKR